MYTFLAYIEEHNRLNQRTPGFVKARTFSLLPFKKGLVGSHFKMCKTGLRSLLQRVGQKIPGAGSEWNAVANATWRELFNIGKFATASRKFAGETLADGKSVSVVLRKPKRKSTPCNINLADYDVVWAWIPVAGIF
uniref:Uncharacterized protein n=1 Tax=Globisporangium ultimum (strain ATCC 200006 / CBS 805.95 / DAOM BR144) TaxID=431595 RepID=K3W548_GLOUD